MFDAAAFQSLRRGHWGSALEWHPSLASTQDFLREQIRAGSAAEGAVIGAEEQSAGRGRWGRSWEGRAGQSLLFSVLLPPLPKAHLATQVPLLLGVGLQRALHQLGLQGLQLRWPNDLTWRGHKLAGLIVEQEGARLVLGLGLNVAQEADAFSGELRGKAASLKVAGLNELRREPILAALLLSLERAWKEWEEQGFEPSRLAWESCAEGRGGALLEVQPTSGAPFHGAWAGLDVSGALKIQPENGPLRLLVSGEVQRLLYPPSH